MNANRNANVVKLKLKVGGAEIDYEGNETFLIDHVFGLLEYALKDSPRSDSAPPVVPDPSDAGPPKQGLDIDTNTVASYLDAKTGPDLVFAAAVNLRLIQGKSRFTRNEIRQEMQSANSYWKQSDSSNLSQYLEGMVKSRKLLRASNGEFSLSADSEREASKLLAESQ